MSAHQHHAKIITNAIFPNNIKKKKIARETFGFQLETTYLAGQVYVLESLLKIYADQPCSMDELVGDIQIKLVETFNSLNKNYGLKLKDLNLESLLN